MPPLWIMVAGPISAPDENTKANNLRLLNKAALEVSKKGHTPIIAHNLASPIRDVDASQERQERYLSLCISLVERCDAILMVGRSPGADLEMNRFTTLGKKVFWKLSEI